MAMIILSLGFRIWGADLDKSSERAVEGRKWVPSFPHLPHVPDQGVRILFFFCFLFYKREK